MDYSEKKIRTVIRHEGIIVTTRLDQILLSNKQTTLREVVEHPGGVTVVPIDDEGYVYCVEQYRYPFSEHMLETPAGKLERGEDPMRCAIRELSEETGITAGEIVGLGQIYPSPGYCHEILYAYLARRLTFGESHPDENEFLSVNKVHIDKLVEMIYSGEIKDAKTTIAVLKAKHYMEAGANG